MSADNHSARDILNAWSDECRLEWSTDSKLNVACAYIDSLGTPDSFSQFVGDGAREEANFYHDELFGDDEDDDPDDEDDG